MQEIAKQKEEIKGSEMDYLSLENKQNLVDAFIWLVQEDKKQNPSLYHSDKQKKHD